MKNLTDEAKKFRSLYYKEWRKKNPDKVKAAQARYWEKKAAQLKTEGGVQRDGKAGA